MISSSIDDMLSVVREIKIKQIVPRTSENESQHPNSEIHSFLTKKRSTMSLEELLHLFYYVTLKFKIQVQLFHWNTNDADDHTVSGEIYDVVEKSIDPIIETSNGTLKTRIVLGGVIEYKTLQKSSDFITMLEGVLIIYRFLVESDSAGIEFPNKSTLESLIDLLNQKLDKFKRQ